ncbi:MAG TPA: efflux transporter periplasmic adaptor subunit, partial [Methylomirabilota bacterium]
RVPLERKPMLLIPEAAIGHDQQGAYLLVVNDKNVVERRNITTGPAVEARRAVVSGLTGDESVIVNGLLKAAPGRQVAPEREGAGGAPGPSAPARKAEP